MYGYLSAARVNKKTNRTLYDSLEPPLVLALNLTRHVSQQSLQHAGPLEVVYKSRILRFALLQQIVFV